MNRLVSTLLLFLCLCVPISAQSHASIEALLEAERTDLSGTCNSITFTNEFLQRNEITGDGLDDAVVDYRGLVCDGSSMMYCGSAGCAMNIYVQRTDGSFLKAGGMYAHALEFDRPDPKEPSFLAYLHGNECGRSGAEACIIRFAIRDGQIVELGEVESSPEE